MNKIWFARQNEWDFQNFYFFLFFDFHRCILFLKALLEKTKTISFPNLFAAFFTVKQVLSIYIYIWAYRCMFLGLMVSGGLIEIQTHAWLLINFAHTSPPAQGRFWYSFDLAPPSTPWAWGVWYSKSNTFLKTVYKTRDVKQVAN